LASNFGDRRQTFAVQRGEIPCRMYAYSVIPEVIDSVCR
jgi:hypothetical protein